MTLKTIYLRKHPYKSSYSVVLNNSNLFEKNRRVCPGKDPLEKERNNVELSEHKLYTKFSTRHLTS